MDKNDGDFIKISQVVGQAKVVGPLSFWQITPIISVILLVCGLNPLIGLFNSILLGAWLWGVMLMVMGGRPDRFNRRLRGKPKRWRRGFHASSPLLKKSNETNDFKKK